MNVETVTSQGKGIVESLSSPEYKFIEKQMFLPMVSEIRKEAGLFGFLKLLFRSHSEKKKMFNHDWSKLENKGVPKEVIEATFQPISLIIALDAMLGIKKAKEIITEIYEKTELRLIKKNSAFNLFSIPVKDLISSKDRFLAFKEYTMSQFEAGRQEKLHDSKTLEDSEDKLAVDVSFCVAHEVARELGNVGWSFPWCEIDEVVYPRMSVDMGFTYVRSGSLPEGASKCSFRFERSRL